MASDVMVDSNVFIDLLRLGRDPASLLMDWATDRNLATCGMIRLEVMRGVILPKTHRSMSSFFDAMVNVPTTKRLWEEAADLAWKLDRKGIVIPGSDLIIAACAMKTGAAVLTSDAHFENIEGLRFITPPAQWLAP
jgi:predicted nucleic acid-binding protein